MQKIKNVDSTYEFQMINENQITKILINMGFKSYDDNITSKVLLDAMCSFKFKSMFINLLNMSLSSGIVPNCFKCCVVEPIKKSMNPKMPEDYRPINTLPIFEKILELHIKESFVEYFEKNKIFIEEQSGFRKKHSCESAINYVLFDWQSSLEKSKNVIVVALDLKRAFETISRQMLLNKLDKYGIKNKEYRWFQNYFINRVQCLKLNGSRSNWLNVENGASQGSVLAPLLFILYINDIVNVIEYVKIRLFADDALLYVDCENIEEGIKCINSDLENVYKWMCANKLAINVKKSNYMLVTRKKINLNDGCRIMIGSECLQRVQVIKYLGVLLDEKMKLKENLTYVENKLYKKLALFRRLGKKLNAETKIILYKSIVAPHFDYCSSLLFALKDSNIKQLQKMQNKFMRNILKLKKDTSVSFMLNILCLLSIKQRLAYNVIKIMHSIESDQSPQYLKNFMLKTKSKNNYNLRRNSLYDVPNFKKSNSQDSLFYKGIQLFNRFKDYVNQDKNNLSFKSNCVNFVKNNIDIR